MENKFKKGDKVVPISKTVPYYSGLSGSGEWSKGKQQGYLYITSWDIDGYYLCSAKINNQHGNDFFNELI